MARPTPNAAALAYVNSVAPASADIHPDRTGEVADTLDPGIAKAVMLLRRHGVETFESCEGGPGHYFPEPTVRFNGGRGEGLRALGIALIYRLPVKGLRMAWSVDADGNPCGPTWELVFA